MLYFRAKKNRIKKIVKNYVNILEQADFPVEQAYLYGSYAKGTADKNSDIDVGIISKKFNYMDDQIIALLWNKIRDVDYRIEPHGFTPEDFQDECDPMVHEIKETGIRIV